MPPNLRQKLQSLVQAVPRVLATAKATNISFFALFLADTGSVFGNRQDQDKYEIFLRLSKVSALAPYLAETVLFSPSLFLSNGDVPPRIRFPIVVKPIRGAQSLGIVGIRDENALRHFLRKRYRPCIAQHFIPGALEIGVSFTRNPAGPPDFFGVAAKQPVVSKEEWKNGFYKVPKNFYHQDITHNVDRERFLELCRTIAATLRTNTLRFDAFIRNEGKDLKLDTMQIIEVNTGIFAADEFLFDTRHAPQFVVEELARRYTYLLLWGGRHTPHPTPTELRKLLTHYLYCYAVTLYHHFMETALMSKFCDFFENRRSNRHEWWTQ
jgi:hypothetical protein